MKGDDLPPADHIVRYVAPTKIQEDGTADGAAFHLRPDETGLSVNWLEVFEGDKVHQLAEVRRLFRRKVAKTGRFAELNIGAVREKMAENEKVPALRIVDDRHEAEGVFEADPSHAEITGLPPGNSPEADMIGDMIAECVIDMHPAIDEA